MKTIATAGITALVAAALAGGIGYNAKPTPDPVTIEKIVEVDKIVKITPDSCLTALSLAEDIFASTLRALEHSDDTVKAAVRLDAETIMQKKAAMDIETAYLKIIAPKYQTARTQCRTK